MSLKERLAANAVRLAKAQRELDAAKAELKTLFEEYKDTTENH